MVLILRGLLLIQCFLYSVCLASNVPRVRPTKFTQAQAPIELRCGDLETLNTELTAPLNPGDRLTVTCSSACISNRMRGCDPWPSNSIPCRVATWLGIPVGQPFDIVAWPELPTFEGCTGRTLTIDGQTINANDYKFPAKAFTLYKAGATKGSCPTKMEEAFEAELQAVMETKDCKGRWRCDCAANLYRVVMRYSMCISPQVSSRMDRLWCKRIRAIASQCNFALTCPLCLTCLENSLSLVRSDGRRISSIAEYEAAAEGGEGDDDDTHDEDDELKALLALGTPVGRLEVYHNGGWGRVCKTNFVRESYIVACKAMGFAGGVPCLDDPTRGGRDCISPGPNTRTFILEPQRCDGSEPSLLDCVDPRNGFKSRWERVSDKCTVDIDGPIQTYPGDVGIRCFVCSPFGAWRQDVEYTTTHRLGNTPLLTRENDAVVVNGLLDDVQIFANGQRFRDLIVRWDPFEKVLLIQTDDGSENLGVLGTGKMSPDCEHITWASGERWEKQEGHLPPLRSFIERLPQAEQLLNLLGIAKLNSLLLVDDTTPITLLVPTNDAFSKIPVDRLEELLTANGDAVQQLQSVIRNHVIEGIWDKQRLVKGNGKVTTLGGIELQFGLNELDEVVASLGGTVVAKIISSQSDNRAANGIYHFIDAVIQPGDTDKARCIDRTGIELGDVAQVLGVGVFGGECKQVVGDPKIVPRIPKLFTDVDSCRSKCFPSPPPPVREVPLPSGTGTTVMVFTNRAIKIFKFRVTAGKRCVAPKRKDHAAFKVADNEQTTPRKGKRASKGGAVSIDRKTGKVNTEDTYIAIGGSSKQPIGFAVTFSNHGPETLCGGEVAIQSATEVNLRFYVIGGPEEGRPFGAWRKLGPNLQFFPTDAQFGGIHLPQFGGSAVLFTSSEKVTVTRVRLMREVDGECKELSLNGFVPWDKRSPAAKPSKNRRANFRPDGRITRGIGKIPAATFVPDVGMTNSKIHTTQKAVIKGLAIYFARQPEPFCGGMIEILSGSGTTVVSQISMWTTPGKGKGVAVDDWELMKSFKAVVGPTSDIFAEADE